MTTSDSLLQPPYPTACGGEISNPAGYPSAEYRGRRYYFCFRACLRVFESKPDEFMAGKIPHPLEEDEAV